MSEIRSIIIKAFGEWREELTEQDLEKIMNTKMITNENTAGAVQHAAESVGAPVPTSVGLSELFEGIKKAQGARSLSADGGRELYHESNDTISLEALATRRFTSLRNVSEGKSSVCNKHETVERVTKTPFAAALLPT